MTIYLKTSTWFRLIAVFQLVPNVLSQDKGSRSVNVHDCTPPPNFPSGITLISRYYENWARDITIPSAWIAIPKTPEDVVILANWAYQHDFRLRPKGGGHNFSPLTYSSVEASTKCPKMILVETTKHLHKMSFNSDDNNNDNIYVNVEAGASMDNLLAYLEKKGYGIYACPAIGDVSVGGVLAVGAHGTGIPGSLDSKSPGHTYGSMSNLIVSMTLIAWDYEHKTYVLKTIHRSEKDCKAFLTHLGRAFVTSVSLRVGKNQNLRKIAEFQISSDDLFARSLRNKTKTNNTNTTSVTKEDSSKPTLSELAEKYGRVEVNLFPFGRYPMLLLWYSVPEKPETSKRVTQPYPYIFMNYVPRMLDFMAGHVFQYVPFLARAVGIASPGSQLGMTLTRTRDLWGPSANHLLFLSKSTMHMTIDGYAILTSPKDLQRVLFTVKTCFEDLLQEYANRGEYPVNGGLDIRISGTDDPREINVPFAEPPTLSVSKPVEGKPEFNRVVWLDLGSFPNTPLHSQFIKDVENYFFSVFNGKWAVVRPEWSKGWAYTNENSWANKTIIKDFIPNLYTTLNDTENGWAWTIAKFNYYDPHKVFTNEFLEYLFST